MSKGTSQPPAGCVTNDDTNANPLLRLRSTEPSSKIAWRKGNGTRPMWRGYALYEQRRQIAAPASGEPTSLYSAVTMPPPMGLGIVWINWKT